MFTRKSSVACTAIGVAFSAALACTPALAADMPIVGTGDGMVVLQAIAKAFNAENPGTNAMVPPSIGSGGAIAAVGTDQQVLGRVARPLNDKEKAQGLIYTPVMRIPSAIIAHPSAGVVTLSVAQLRAIFEGSVTSWKEVGGKDVRIRVVRREDADSTLGVLRDTMPGWKDLVFTTKSKTSTTTQDMLQTVSSTEGAIGFAPYDSSLAGSLSVLAVDGRKPIDGGYPSAVVVALIYKDAALTPEAKKFVAYAKSEKAKAILTGLGAVGN